MKKITHIDFGITTMLGSAYFLNIFSPVFVLLPFLAILSDADHWQDSLSRKGLSLPWHHRWWSHSIFWTVILSLIVSIVLYTILYFTYKYGFWKNIPVDLIIKKITSSYLYIWGLWLGLVIILSTIQKFLGKLVKFFIWFIMLFWFIAWLFYLYFTHHIDLTIFLVVLFITSHLLGDYFTVSWIPLLYPLNTKDRYKFLLYVSTDTQWEEFVKFVITIVNIIIIYLLYINNYGDVLSSYKVSITDLILLVVWFLTIFYFLNRELNFKRNVLKKSWKVIKNTVWSIIKTLFTISISAWILLLSWNIYKGTISIWLWINNINIIISWILWILWFFGIIISLKNLWETIWDLFDVSDLFVYTFIFMLEFVMWSWMLYKYFIS